MKAIENYTSVSDWKTDVEKEGYIAGTAVCWGLSNTMKENGMTFPQAYDYLMKSGKLFIAGKNFIIDVATLK